MQGYDIETFDKINIIEEYMVKLKFDTAEYCYDIRQLITWLDKGNKHDPISKRKIENNIIQKIYQRANELNIPCEEVDMSLNIPMFMKSELIEFVQDDKVNFGCDENSQELIYSLNYLIEYGLTSENQVAYLIKLHALNSGNFSKEPLYIKSTEIMDKHFSNIYKEINNDIQSHSELQNIITSFKPNAISEIDLFILISYLLSPIPNLNSDKLSQINKDMQSSTRFLQHHFNSKF